MNFSEQAFKAILENESEQLGISDLKSRAESVQQIKKKIEEVYTDDGKVALYIINFGNEEGYMVISGDKESSSIVLSYNSVGSLNYSTLDKTSTVALWLEAKRQEISKKLNSDKNPNNEESYQIWDGFSTDDSKKKSTIELLTSENLKYNTESDQKLSKASTNNNYSNMPVRWPIVNNTWGQGQGYNADAKNGALIGCTVVAVGLICRYHCFPTGANFDYANMPRKLKDVRTSNPISRMFRAIANAIPNYKWGENPGDESIALLTDTEKGLRKLGYKKANYRNFDLNIAYNNIKDHGPIILAGFKSSGGVGHLWVADGFSIQTLRISNNSKVSNKTLAYMYMNWGWDGYGNGWINQSEWTPYKSKAAYNNDGSLYPDRHMFSDVYPVK